MSDRIRRFSNYSDDVVERRLGTDRTNRVKVGKVRFDDMHSIYVIEQINVVSIRLA